MSVNFLFGRINLNCNFFAFFKFKKIRSHSNGLSYPFKKKLGAVSNGLSYPFKKNWEPSERLELYVSKKVGTVRTGCSWRTAGDMF